MWDKFIVFTSYLKSNQQKTISTIYKVKGNIRLKKNKNNNKIYKSRYENSFKDILLITLCTRNAI